MAAETAVCGTRSGYIAHLRRGEVTCKACCRANVAAQSGRNAAESRALSRLRKAHPVEYRALYVDELGYEPKVGRPHEEVTA